MKQDTIFEYDGKQYSIGSTDAMEQFHIFRRMLPVLNALGVGAMQLLMDGQEASKVDKTQWVLMAMPALAELSKMPQVDVDYVIFSSLKHIRRKEGDSWASLITSQGGFMFADLKMFCMLRLVMEFLRHNLGDFFDLLQAEVTS